VKGVKRVLITAIVLALSAAAAIVADVLRPSQPQSVAPIELDATRANEKRNRDNREGDGDRAGRPNSHPERDRDRGDRADVRHDGVEAGGADDEEGGGDSSGGDGEVDDSDD
jgi:opacity protein-like surface antigen